MYENYGDTNFFDIGRLIKELEEERSYAVITCHPDCDNENHYELNEFIVFLNDIDKKALEDVCRWGCNRSYSIDYTDDEAKLLAVDVCEYGLLTPETSNYFTKNEVIDWIDHGYINEIEWEFYENNFYQDNRNCVVEIYDKYSQKGTKVYNTLEDALEDFERRAEKGWSLTVIDI